MKRICQACGAEIDNYVYIFRPYVTKEIVKEIKAQLPNINFVINAIEGSKIKIELKKILTSAQKQIMDEYFNSRGYSEDEEAEKKEVYG